MNTFNSLTKFFAFATLCLVILIAATSLAFAQRSKKNLPKSAPTKLWQQIDENSLQSDSARADGQGSRLPEKYLVFRLNRKSLKDSLAELPLADTDAAREKNVVMEIPQADGTIQRFRMEETPLLSPELAAQYPSWKFFIGYGVDDPQATGRFDWNVQGFHGYIETAKGTVVIDPYQKGDTENYLVYYKNDYGKSEDAFSCKIKGDMSSVIDSDYKPDFLPRAPEFALGAALRTYKIAIATTGEWSRNAAGAGATTPQQIRDGALGVVSTAVNRISGIYTRELSSTFQLVNPPTSDNARNIIFDDPATDPYNNTDQAEDKPATAGSPAQVDQLRVNQETLDARVLSANYDIGHLFGTGGGGVASYQALCQNGSAANGVQYNNVKAQGYSARGNDTGDPFVVDYVAHEIGHQFGGSHTYNTSDADGACITRSATNAFEPASGSTIMSYVGICNNTRNLQQFVDAIFPSFHIRSLTEINDNLTTGAPANIVPCGTNSGTNSIPTVNAGNAYTIPKLTPFTLTATGSDGDAGDVANLLYSWEEYDLAPSPSGSGGTPSGVNDIDNDGVQRPILRAYSPVSSNSRTFPSLTFVLNPANNDQSANVNSVSSNQPVLTYTGTHPTGFPGAVCQTGQTCVVGERLPTINRTMNFRVAVRDRRGGVQDAGTTVTVAAAAGPFQVTTQNAAATSAPQATWQANTTQTVTWDVAGTTANGINAANVNILLSTDGGLTFPITLKANTPNDGTEPITVPNNPTDTARIKVEAVDNIFFDINNANFAITAPTAATVSISGRVVSTSGRGVSNALVALTDRSGAVRTTKTTSFGYYRFDNVEAGGTYIFNVSHKRYQSSTRVSSVVENLDEFNFVISDYLR